MIRIHRALGIGVALLLLPGAGPAWSDQSADPPPMHDHSAHHAPQAEPDDHSAHHGDSAKAHDHSAHGADPAMGHDEHAAHRAALEKPRYSVTTEPYAVPDVELIDESGKSVALRALLATGQPVALNFIFTTCTTICPVMTATFAQMRRELEDTAPQLRYVSISIDPEYDRPEVLKEYARRFGAGTGWTFLTGDSADISQVLVSFDAYAGSKMNHQPITLLKSPESASWIRIDGLASGQDLAREATARLLN